MCSNSRGTGTDTLLCGTGNDRFDWHSVSEAGKSALRDIVSDFARGSDKINLADIDARSGTTTNDAFGFIGTAPFSGAAGQLRYELFDTAGEDYTLGNLPEN
jgi:Ca2+-binding RTX toxin-like protein